jgi:outer membrane protein insertion porin family
MALILRCIAFLMLATAAALAMAIEPFVIKDIRVEGIQRTEAGTVFSYLPVKVGDQMTEDKAAQAIRALFATGFFKDVSIEADNNTLVVVVVERPSIALIEFKGNKEFDKEALLKGIKQIGISEGRIYDRSLVERAEQELKRQYLSRGKYAVEIHSTFTPLERNRVSLNFNVIEGDTAKIRQITIIGSRAFKEKELLELFYLREPGYMTWFSKQDQYSREKLSADLETLKSHYQDRGYLEFNVESTQVSITPDKKDIYITVVITEGDKYTVSEVKVAGQLLVPEAEIRKLIDIKPGDIFSRSKLQQSTKKINDRLGNDGYAFANVNAVPELNKEKKLASFSFYVDPGRRVYVRWVNVTGNSKTRDEVVRREIRQVEGAWFAQEKINESKMRLDRLGYFTDVRIDNPAVAGTTDQVDVNFAVTEKPTGSVMLGAGFGSGTGLILSTSVSQQNIFGSGRALTLALSTSSYNTIYSLSYTNPYFTPDGLSFGYDIYDRETNAAAVNLGNYKTQTIGASLRFGVPISSIDTIQYGIGLEQTNISINSNSPLYYLDYVNAFGDSSVGIPATVGWVRDGRDSYLYPTTGVFHNAYAEIGLPGGNLLYARTSYQYQRYFPLSRDYTLMANGQLGVGDGYGGKIMPFFKNFFAGGVGSLRGYKLNTVGPLDSQGFPRGGDRQILGNLEVLYPFPGLRNDHSVRLSNFIDTGQVSNGSFQFGSLRYSTGVALTWISPMGPLKISLAKALSHYTADHHQFLQFTFGGLF